MTAQSWHAPLRGLIRTWGESVRIIRYDHRGHGESDSAPMSSYRIDQLAADLADVLVELNVVGSVTLAGHSMGGMTALAFCGQHPASRPVQPHGLVLVAAAAGRLAERGLGRLLATPAAGLFAALVAHAPAAVADRTVRALVGPVCEILGRSRGYGSVDLRAVAALSAAALTSSAVSTAAGFLSNLRAYNQYSSLGAVAAATVVVSGGADLLIPPAHVLDLVAGIRGTTHVHRPEAGHMLLHDAAPAVTQAISHVVSQDSSALCTNSLQGPCFHRRL